MADSIFDDIQKKAVQAEQIAVYEMQRILTRQFRDHLRSSRSVPRNLIGQCSIVHDPDTDGFFPQMPEEVQQIDLGSADRSPTGLTRRFFNRINVSKMHSQELYKAAKKVGLA